MAAAATAAGATLVNDVTALRGDPEMADVVAAAGADCCLMHMLGDPRTMQDDPHYDDVGREVKAFLEERMAFAVARGVAEERIMLDPGIGFGKTREHNLELLRRLGEIVALGRPVVIGTSRKSFLGKITGSRSTTASRRRSRPTCSRTSAGLACSGSTTWLRSTTRWRSRLLRSSARWASTTPTSSTRSTT